MPNGTLCTRICNTCIVCSMAIVPPLQVILFLAFMDSLIAIVTYHLAEKKNNQEIITREN
ncbi:MAG: hypothetical protein BMS9Abin02_1562 [Anaerolineae bacterium]|nr:MAG: hypothetical protein BMS9Abin02_1562 [Anaerolineae bacterium]